MIWLRGIGSNGKPTPTLHVAGRNGDGRGGTWSRCGSARVDMLAGPQTVLLGVRRFCGQCLRLARMK